jgi:hypothetical protein
MFGAVCSGRPIQLASQVEANKYVITIPNGMNVNFVTIFLLPNQVFDNNYTALIYIQLPNSDFNLLGGLNVNKPSAIYKLNNHSPGHNNSGVMDDIDMNVDGGGSGDVNNDANQAINIGISIELNGAAEIQLQLIPKNVSSSNSTSSIKPADTAILANKIVGHAYNYLSGFVDNNGKVPMKAFDTWWDKFKVKLQNNPNFLNELQDN